MIKYLKNVLNRIRLSRRTEQDEILKSLNEISSLLRVQDERSVNAYSVLNAIMAATNTVDDKIERFQGMYQTNSVLAHDNEKNFAMLEYICRIRKLFPIMSVDDEEHKLVRVGKADDGGYIMLDDYADSKIAYSFGIADDVSWDKAFVNAGGGSLLSI